MPTPSAEPIRLQVINRIIVVLKAITAGSDYWYTPGRVEMRFLQESEITSDVCYAVTVDDKGGPIETAGAPHEYDETFYVTVRGVVACTEDDYITRRERALCDVRKAINEDTKNGTAGSLMCIADIVVPADGPEMDDGTAAASGFAFFNQQFSVHIHGDFGEL